VAPVFPEEFIGAGHPIRAVAILQWRSRTRDPTGIRTGAGPLPGEGDGECREFGIPIGESGRGRVGALEGSALGSKGVGRQDFGPGPGVFAVNLGERFRRVEQGVGRPEGQARRVPPSLEFGADGPVEPQGRPAGEALGDGFTGIVNTRRGSRLLAFPQEILLGSPALTLALASPGMCRVGRSLAIGLVMVQPVTRPLFPGTDPDARRLAVFCDFDGTFSQRDVGAALAQKFLPRERADLQKRYAEGGLGAWEYAVELFDGFDFGPEALDTFLADIELDVGARELLAWCQGRGVGFRILSDGFDYNLDRLQAIHGVRFAYSANHLAFESGRWRISPGGLNPECSCGTGSCKRAILDAHRRRHPGTLCVHIGDGAVSDLCGALAADRVFAKGSLAEALRARGHPFELFDDLSGVCRALEGAFPEDPPAGEPGRRASEDFRS